MQGTPAAGASGGGRRPPQWRRTLDSWGGLPVLGALGVAILVVVVLVWINRPGSSVSGGEYVPLERAEVSGRRDGAADAPVTIFEFADFQCPVCRRFTDEVAPSLLTEFIEPGIVQVQFVHFAFLGPESIRAAEAAECAADQNHFWDYHDVLFLRQGAENAGVFSDANLKKFARELADHFDDFDVKVFDSCLDSGEKEGVVRQATQQASQLGVDATPSFVIGNQLLRGYQTLETLRTVIQAAQGAGG